MRYVVVGAGAVGGVIAGRLHAAGADVALVARGRHLEAIQAGGLRLEAPRGPERHVLPAFSSVAAVGLSSQDVVLLAVKSQDTEPVLADVQAHAPPDVVVACAQNGVANERSALRRFCEVQGVCVYLPGVHVEPGVVVQQSAVPGCLEIGRWPAGVDDHTLHLADALGTAGFLTLADPLVVQRKYRKLLVNLVNALDALCGVSSRLSVLADRARAEGEACLQAAGIAVGHDDESDLARRAAVMDAVLPRAGSTGSSSWQSLARGTGTVEADWLNGEIALLGRLHGVPTPVNDLLQRTANRAARRRLPPGSMTVDELMGMLDADA